jgi:hypothetical protein
MSFLKQQPGAGMQPNSMDAGLGRLIGADPSRIGTIADRIGTAANGIAAAGGAAQSYAAPQQPNNYMQLLDPNVLRAIYAQFGGGPATAGYAR